MEKRIKKLLIGFFVFMFIFTILSRAAAAAVVAKVQIDTVKSGNLTYEVTGTGIVKANGRKYMDLITGYKIGKLAVKEGDKVKKGDLLFSYNIEQLKETKTNMEDELKKLQLQYKNIGLTDDNTDNTSDKETAELAVENAKAEVETAQADLEDVKRSVKENKEKEYKEAVSEWEDAKASEESAEKEAERTIEDKQEELTEIMKPETTARETIGNYREAVKSSSDSIIENAYSALFDYYYDGKYEEHQIRVKAAETELDRAEEDYTATSQKWKNTYINKDDKYDEDMAIRNAYYEKINLKKEELNTAERRVQDAEEALEELTKEDEVLAAAITAYQTAVVSNPVNTEVTAEALFKILSEGKLAKQSKVDAAKTELSRAEEDKREVEKDWEKKVNTAKDKADKLLWDLNTIKDGSYDYTEAEKDMKKALQEAEKTLTSAELQLKQVEERGQEAKVRQNNQEASEDVERSILMVDINKKQQELAQVQKMIRAKGNIYAPVDGVISDNDLEQGLTLTGQEKLIITTGGYELAMTAGEEDMKYFSAGDEITVKTGADNSADGNTVTSEIENINLADQDGKISFTAILQDGDYQLGASLEYVLRKDSQSYNMCIPLQALRQDSQGTYVLLAKETDSVLGTIEEAFRLNVTVLSQDLKSAAVDASLTEEDKIITGSNRNFNEGDRVRIYEKE